MRSRVFEGSLDQFSVFCSPHLFSASLPPFRASFCTLPPTRASCFCAFHCASNGTQQFSQRKHHDKSLVWPGGAIKSVFSNGYEQFFFELLNVASLEEHFSTSTLFCLCMHRRRKRLRTHLASLRESLRVISMAARFEIDYSKIWKWC